MDIVKLLDQLPIKTNYQRKNVSDGGCFSTNMGLIHRRYKTGVCLSKITTEYPATYDALVSFCQSNNPGFEFTTITINRNFQCKPHVDKMNHGLSRIIGLGDYRGGQLRIHHPNGTYTDHDIKNQWLEFDGKQLHETLPFTGNRYTLIYFTHRATVNKHPI